MPTRRSESLGVEERLARIVRTPEEAARIVSSFYPR